MLKLRRLLVVLLAASLAFLSACRSEQAGLLEAQVKRVIDGDTIEVLIAGRGERVRYIGVDAPETRGGECFAKEAKAFNETLVAGKRIWLELDVQQRDRYGRLLAYVWLEPEKQRMVNALLLSEGYAQLMTIPPNVKYMESFRQLQSDARQAAKGLWVSCDVG